MSLRFGRRKVVVGILTVSALLSCVVALMVGVSYWLVVAVVLLYSVTVTADSGSLTAGTVTSANPNMQGATMAVHSSLGVGVSFIGPLIVGIVLDVFGGATLGWTLAFISMGAGALLGAWAVARLVQR
jgi:MFS family permease